MARPPRFTVDGILDAAAEAAVERWREATVTDVAARLGTPTNSVYYRFATRDALFGALWLRAVRRFHVGLLAAAADPDPHLAAVATAVHIPRFCREHHADAVAMTLYRQPDLLALLDQEHSADLHRGVRDVNLAVGDAMRELTRRRFGSDAPELLGLVAVACQEAPYGLVRRHLRSDVPMPPWLDDAVAASCTAILALGDGPAAALG